MLKNTIIQQNAPLLWEQHQSLLSINAEICNYTFQILKLWNHPKNFGQYWRLYWNQKPGGKIIYQNKRYLMNSKTVFLIPSHISTATELEGEVPHFAINFKIGGSFERVHRKIYQLPPQFLKQALFDFSKLTSEVARLMIIQSIVSYYLSMIPSKQFHKLEQDNLDPRISKTIAIMESELATPLTNANLCRLVGMSRNNFYRLFKQETQKTPNFFRLELRMIKARWLLCNTDKSIGDIVQEIGYSDRYQFSKAFKTFFGLSPIIYRIESQKQKV